MRDFKARLGGRAEGDENKIGRIELGERKDRV